MPINIGDPIPSVELYENSPETKVDIQKICGTDKKVILFALPGAYTPGCSKTHLPGYVKDADSLKKRGFDEIVCVSVNDPYVMAAWGTEHKAIGKVRMLADPEAAFTKAVDLAIDLPNLGGIRSKRYSMIIRNGLVSVLNIEPDGTGLSCSLSKNIKDG